MKPPLFAQDQLFRSQGSSPRGYMGSRFFERLTRNLRCLSMLGVTAANTITMSRLDPWLKLLLQGMKPELLTIPLCQVATHARTHQPRKNLAPHLISLQNRRACKATDSGHSPPGRIVEGGHRVQETGRQTAKPTIAQGSVTLLRNWQEVSQNLSSQSTEHELTPRPPPQTSSSKWIELSQAVRGLRALGQVLLVQKF
jgi:hypothetical protein